MGPAPGGGSHGAGARAGPGGPTVSRLMLRLTTRCNSGCAHCTIADIAHHGERSLEEAWEEVQRGRAAGAAELVIMRGEATLRARDLLRLTRRSRRIGYEHVQLQTNARMLAYSELVVRLVDAGVTFFEVSWFGHTAALHDAIDGTPGAFVQARAGLENLLAAGVGLLVTVPVIAANTQALPAIVADLADLGVGRVQLNFSRPVQVAGVWRTEPLVRLAVASPHIRAALAVARERGVFGETEAVPLCHLDVLDHRGGDVDTDFGEHAVSDVHRREEDLREHRRRMRPFGPECGTCTLRRRCPTTWAAYQELYGTAEFRAFG